MQPAQTDSSETYETGAFAETVQKLWDVHCADLRRLQGENQRLCAKIRRLEGHEETPEEKPEKSGQPGNLVPSTTLNTEEMSDAKDLPTHKQSSLKHQPRSAWAKVLPHAASQERKLDLFDAGAKADDLPRSFWSLSEKLVSHPMFDIVAAALICANAIVMAMESQFQGLSIGADLKYSKLHSDHNDAWTSAEPVFVVLGYIFGGIFSAELLLKIIGQRGNFPRRTQGPVFFLIG